MMMILVLVILGLNLVSLFVDTPGWYTVMMGIATFVTFILVTKNSNTLKKLRQKKN